MQTGRKSVTMLALASVLACPFAGAEGIAVAADAPDARAEVDVAATVASLARVRVRGATTIEGTLVAVERDALVVATDTGGLKRVPNHEVRSLEIREGGSPALGVVGALAGLAGGAVAAGLVCMTADTCGQEMLWLGAVVGMTVGATAGSARSWRSVPLVRRNGVSFGLQPRQRGAALVLNVGF